MLSLCWEAVDVTTYSTLHSAPGTHDQSVIMLSLCWEAVDETT